jgi:hypothetical protein
MMQRLTRIAIVAGAALSLAACSAGSTTAPSITVVPPGVGDKLQFAVGTANIYGGTAGAATGLNVVSTFRQGNGHSATGVNTPFITGPFTLPAGMVTPAIGGLAVGGALSDPYTTLWTGSATQTGGPSLPEVSTNPPAITGTPQTVTAGTPACDGVNPPAGFTTCLAGIQPNATTFGQSGGDFAMGIAPYNTTADTQQSYSYAPYQQPLYDAGATPLFVPWGGPPAFDPDGNGMGTRDGLIQAGNDGFWSANGVCCNYFLGVGEGVTVFEGVAASAGAYKLALQIATIGSGGGVHITTITANAQLGSAAFLLGPATAPLVTPDLNDGGASMNVTMPGSATEAVVQIVDYGPGGGPLSGGGTVANCQGQRGPAFAPVYYTIEVTQTGPASLPQLDGPNSATGGGIGNLIPSPSICTQADNNGVGAPNAGDNFTVQLIGFDYPEYEAAVSLLHPPVPAAPQIIGGNGQSDITISPPVEEDWTAGGYVATTLSRAHRPFRHLWGRPLRSAKPKTNNASAHI